MFFPFVVFADEIPSLVDLFSFNNIEHVEFLIVTFSLKHSYLQVSPGVVAWSMLSNLFTEVLSRTAWLKMMDYLFCHFEDISLILIAPIVVMRDLKTTLLTCDTANQVLFHSFC